MARPDLSGVSAPLARHAMAYVLAGGRGSRTGQTAPPSVVVAPRVGPASPEGSTRRGQIRPGGNPTGLSRGGGTPIGRCCPLLARRGFLSPQGQMAG